MRKLDESLDRSDRLWSALFHLVARRAPEPAAELLEERADRLIKQKKFENAARRLALRLDLPEADDETRFSLAVARLKSGRRDLGGLAHRRDEALELFAALERGTFPVASRLAKSRVLAAEESFYVGFNLAEQPATRDTATHLLRHVATRSPRTKLGRAAKNKLALLERKAG